MYGASNFLLAFLHFYFSILCAYGLLFTPSLHKIVSELVGVNSNEGLRRKNTQTGRSMRVYVVR